MMAEKGRENSRDLVIVFTRFPVVGEVKTRLAKGVGAKEACRVHDRLSRHAVRQVRAWGGDFEIRITGGEESAWHEWLGELRWKAQGGGDLGERMKRAVEEAFDKGFDRVVVMGTDCPGLDSQVIRSAFSALCSADVVFGPAADGGYYLVGLNAPVFGVFDDIRWGSDTVLAESVSRARAADARLDLLDILNDVDTKEDLGEMEGVP